jgi:hypothetical protein
LQGAQGADLKTVYHIEGGIDAWKKVQRAVGTVKNLFST